MHIKDIPETLSELQSWAQVRPLSENRVRDFEGL